MSVQRAPESLPKSIRRSGRRAAGRGTDDQGVMTRRSIAQVDESAAEGIGSGKTRILGDSPTGSRERDSNRRVGRWQREARKLL